MIEVCLTKFSGTIFGKLLSDMILGNTENSEAKKKNHPYTEK